MPENNNFEIEANTMVEAPNSFLLPEFNEQTLADGKISFSMAFAKQCESLLPNLTIVDNQSGSPADSTYAVSASEIVNSGSGTDAGGAGSGSGKPSESSMSGNDTNPPVPSSGPVKDATHSPLDDDFRFNLDDPLLRSLTPEQLEQLYNMKRAQIDDIDAADKYQPCEGGGCTGPGGLTGNDGSNSKAELAKSLMDISGKTNVLDQDKYSKTR